MIPNSSSRTAIIGRTGSGKSQFGTYYLGKQIEGPWAGLPVTVFNPKNTRILNRIGAKEIKITDKPPKKEGLYMVKPFPGDDDAATVEYLLQVWAQEDHGLYFDEILDLGARNKGFRRLLSQGREKHVPMIYCTQRPAWIDQYAVSEADFFAVFDLSKSDDIIRVKKDVPGYEPNRLARFHSYWYDVVDNKGTILAPCPMEPEILALYEEDRQSEKARSEMPKKVLL